MGRNLASSSEPKSEQPKPDSRKDEPSDREPRRGASSLPGGLVGKVMKKYGFSREEAEEEIKKFGGKV